MSQRRGAIAFGAVGLLLGSCGGGGTASGSANGDDTASTSSTTTASSTATTNTDATTRPGDEDIKFDTLVDTTGAELFCDACYPIDLLIVVDNSASMAQEQAHVAANFVHLVDTLQALMDDSGLPWAPDVNIMVTTTDVGHPLCEPLQKPGDTPRGGMPVFEGCNARIGSFTGVGENPAVVEDACTGVCPRDVVPMDPFVHFDPEGSTLCAKKFEASRPQKFTVGGELRATHVEIGDTSRILGGRRSPSPRKSAANAGRRVGDEHPSDENNAGSRGADQGHASAFHQRVQAAHFGRGGSLQARRAVGAAAA